MTKETMFEAQNLHYQICYLEEMQQKVLQDKLAPPYISGCQIGNDTRQYVQQVYADTTECITLKLFKKISELKEQFDKL